MFGPTPTREEHKDIGKMEVMFKLNPPKKSVAEGIHTILYSCTHIRTFHDTYIYICILFTYLNDSCIFLFE